MIDLEITNGVAWEALPSERVEEPRLPWAAALEVERGAQLWSLRRRASQ